MKVSNKYNISVIRRFSCRYFKPNKSRFRIRFLFEELKWWWKGVKWDIAFVLMRSKEKTYDYYYCSVSLEIKTTHKTINQSTSFSIKKNKFQLKHFHWHQYIYQYNSTYIVTCQQRPRCRLIHLTLLLFLCL